MIPDKLLMNYREYHSKKCRELGIELIVWAMNEPSNAVVESGNFTAHYEMTSDCYEVESGVFLFQYLLKKVVFHG